MSSLIDSWEQARRREFFPIAAEAPWGRRRIVEGVGLGVLAQAIEELRGKKLPPAQAREHIAELVLRAELEPLDIRIDKSLLSGAFALVEVTERAR